MMRKVYLDGEMAQKFGHEFTINAKCVSDVFRNLECNFPELREYLIDCHEKDIGFLCQVGDEALQSEQELILSMGEGDIYISPQPAGSSGIGKILAAIAIVALVVYTGGQVLALANASAAAAGAATTAITVGSAIAATGTLGLLALGVAINLALTGLQELMAPDPSVDDFNNDRETTYLFQGAEQTIIEGNPVPVIYGQLRVPGRPIGFEIRNKDNVFSNTYYNGGVHGGIPFGQWKGYNQVIR